MPVLEGRVGTVEVDKELRGMAFDGVRCLRVGSGGGEGRGRWRGDFDAVVAKVAVNMTSVIHC
jgi:hypothetical protein